MGYMEADKEAKTSETPGSKADTQSEMSSDSKSDLRDNKLAVPFDDNTEVKPTVASSSSTVHTIVTFPGGMEKNSSLDNEILKDEKLQESVSRSESIEDDFKDKVDSSEKQDGKKEETEDKNKKDNDIEKKSKDSDK